MAYTPIPTVSVGDTWTHTDHNTYIKDNFAAGVPDLAQAKGDLFVATTANAASRLAVGTNGQVLVADSAQATGVKWAGDPASDIVQAKGDILAATAADVLARIAAGANGSVLISDTNVSGYMKFSTMPVAIYTKNNTTTVPNTTATIIDFPTSVLDTHSAVTTGAAWKFTVPVGYAGFYLVMFGYQYQSGAWTAGKAAVTELHKNGLIMHQLGQTRGTATYTGVLPLNGAGVVSLVAGDYIQLKAYQDSGG